jgi:peptide/nickel transport system ATP-binding protein
MNRPIVCSGSPSGHLQASQASGSSSAVAARRSLALAGRTRSARKPEANSLREPSRQPTVVSASVRKDVRRLEAIPGSLPPLGVRVPGCVYADRCPIVRDRCRVDPPPLLEVSPTRASRCFYHEEVPAIPPGEEVAAGARQGPREDEVLVRLDGLVKSYRSGGSEVTAVDGVSLEVRRGEVLGLVGESGSGKSSLAKCIVGLIEASAGTIEFEGRPVPASARKRAEDVRRRVQMVFQNPDNALNPSQHRPAHHRARAAPPRRRPLARAARAADA